jgi:hypothetical protein
MSCNVSAVFAPTATPSITPSITPSNSPVVRIQNNCDVITLFDLGISCNVIQNPSSPTSLDGIISVNVTGGTAPYSYYWNGNAGAQTLFGVTQGDYEILVTDFSWPDGGPDYTASTICSLFGPTPTQTPTMTPTPTSTRPIQCVDLCMIITDPILFGPAQFVCNGELVSVSVKSNDGKPIPQGCPVTALVAGPIMIVEGPVMTFAEEVGGFFKECKD